MVQPNYAGNAPAMKPTLNIIPPALRKYVGMRPPIPMEDQFHRAHQQSFTCITELLSTTETSFGRIQRNAVWLCDETEDYLYKGDFGFIDQPYQPGKRPMLERYIAQVVTSDMTDQQKAIALSQSMREIIKDQFGEAPAFLYGETDEETLLKGGGHCSCKGRLLSALAQIVGLQGRPVLMWVMPHPDNPEKMLGGHTGTEIFYDDAWHFFDPSLHWYPITDDGLIPSIGELRKDRGIALNMPADRVAKLAPRMELPKIMDTYLPENFPIAISRHDVNADFRPHWTWATKEFIDKRDRDWDAIKAIAFDLARRGELTDEIYNLDLRGFRARFNLTDANLHPPTLAHSI